MSSIYVPQKPTTSANFRASILGFSMAAAVFATIPLLNTISNLIAPPPIQIVTPTQDLLPPATPIEPDPPEPVVQKTQDIEFEPPTIDVFIGMMTDGLNPSDSGVKVGFDMRTVGGLDTDAKLFLVDQLDQKPRVLVAVTPQYPYGQRDRDAEVIVEFIIGADGEPRRPVIKKSTHRDFERPAIEAVLRSKWEPGMKDNRKVDTLVRLPVRFKK